MCVSVCLLPPSISVFPSPPFNFKGVFNLCSEDDYYIFFYFIFFLLPFSFPFPFFFIIHSVKIISLGLVTPLETA